MRIYMLSKFKNQRLLDEGWVTQTLKELSSGDVTHGGNVKKLSGFVEAVYSIRGTLKARLVFTYGLYQGELSIFLLDILPNHDIPKNNSYDEQVRLVHKMLSGVVLPSDEPDSKAILAALAHTVPAPVYEFNHSGLILSEEQNQLIKKALFPLLLNGPPGAGKTSGLFILLLQLIEQGKEDGRYLYITQTKQLALFLRDEWARSGCVQRAQEKNCTIVFQYAQCASYQEVDEHFLYYTLLDKDKLEHARATEAPIALTLGVAETKVWFDNKLKELRKRPGIERTLQIHFESFLQEKDLLCGYSRAVYLADEFGKRNSLFESSQKKNVYDLYEEYLEFVGLQINEHQVFDFKLCRVSEEQPYDTVLVDETQDCSLRQLQNYKQLSLNNQIVMSIDSNQDLEKGLSLRTHIKGLFTHEGECVLNSLSLGKCFRCPEPVIELANCLITLKNRITGGVTDKDEYSSFQKAAVKEQGDVLLVSSQTLPDAAVLLSRFKDTEVVVVTYEDKKAAAQKLFPNYTVWTPKQVKGMESPCVVGYQLFDRAYFKQANTLLGEASDKVNVHRAKPGEARPFFAPDFNGALTAVTRTKNTLIVVEDKVNELPHLLGPIKNIIGQANQKTPLNSKTILLQPVKTTVNDWKKQVDELLAQGKHHMAEEVFNLRLKATLSVSFAEYRKKDVLPQSTIVAQNTRIESPSNKVESNTIVHETKRAPQVSNKSIDSKDSNKKQVSTLPSATKKKEKNKKTTVQVIKEVQQAPSPSLLLAPVHNPNKKELLIQKASSLLNSFTELFLKIFVNHEELLNYRSLPLPEFNNKTFLEAALADKSKRLILEQFFSKEPGLIRKFFSEAELNNIDYIEFMPRNALNIQFLFRQYTKDFSSFLYQFNDSGFLINHLVTRCVRTLFTAAVHKENAEYVDFLLSIKGIDVNKSDARFGTPLIIAIKSRNINILNLLLQSDGIDVNKVNYEGFTPLFITCQYGEIELVKRLLAHPDIEVNKADEHGSTPLLIACGNGHVELVQLLLDFPGIDINQAQQGRHVPLHLVCQNGSVELVKLLLAQRDLKVNQTSDNERTSLFIACQRGHLEVVKLLLDCPDIDVNKADNDGVTPLLLAYENEHMELVKLLLAHRYIDINKADRAGDTLLHIACQRGDVETVKLILEHPRITMNTGNKKEITPLLIACYKKYTDVAKLLLDCPDIDINKAEQYGITPLLVACNNGHVELVTLLVGPKIKINPLDKNQITPLHLACQHGDIAVVKLLLTHQDIEINKTCLSGNTPLYMASQNGHYEVVKLLLAHPDIEINTANKNGATSFFIAYKQKKIEVLRLLLAHPDIKIDEALQDESLLYMACLYGYIKVVKLLLARPGIDINKVNSHKITPLFVACSKGHFEVVKLLLAHSDIAVNKTVIDGNLPLFIACQNGYIKVVKLLLSYPGIDVNSANKEGVTPLLVACAKRDIGVVKLLLAYPGIEVNHVDKDGSTPLFIACAIEHLEMVALLLEGKANVYHQNADGETALDLAFLQNNTAAIEEIFLYVKKEHLSLTSLMSSKTEDKAREWASSELLSEANRFFASHPLSDLKQFVQQQLASIDPFDVERRSHKSLQVLF